MSKSKGERIQESLCDPERHNVAATEWLLLYAVNKRNGTINQIQDEMINLWEKIHAKDQSFYLVYPGSNDGHNCTSMSLEQELIRFYETGLVQGNCDGQWSLTEKGVRTLNEWRLVIQKKFPFIIQSLSF